MTDAEKDVRIANLLHSEKARTSGLERAAHLIDLGLRVEAAAERDGPEREAMLDAARDFEWASDGMMQAAARALVAMKEG